MVLAPALPDKVLKLFTVVRISYLLTCGFTFSTSVNTFWIYMDQSQSGLPNMLLVKLDQHWLFNYCFAKMPFVWGNDDL